MACMGNCEEKLTHWQVRAKNIIDPILLDPETEGIIRDVRENVPRIDWMDIIRDGLVPSLHLPANSVDFLWHYVATGERDYTKIERAQLYILSEIDETLTPSSLPQEEYKLWKFKRSYENNPGVYLILYPDITKQELINYVDRHFSSDIEPKLQLLRGGPRKRVRRKPQLARDMEIIEAFKRGESPKEIAERYLDGHIDTPEDIRKIIYKYRRRKNP